MSVYHCYDHTLSRKILKEGLGFLHSCHIALCTWAASWLWELMKDVSSPHYERKAGREGERESVREKKVHIKIRSEIHCQRSYGMTALTYNQLIEMPDFYQAPAETA